MQFPLWQAAASFAARRHGRQVRKDGRTPYFAHPFRVAMALRDAFDCPDPVALVAALLHDLIEDTTTDYDDIAQAFGAEVADVVAALTKNMALPEPRREVEYDAALAAAPWQARLVKLGDCYDNLCDALASPYGVLDDAHLGRTLDRCRRSLNLVRPDDPHFLRQAAELVEKLILAAEAALPRVSEAPQKRSCE
ncbi:MAG: bifunctional (p)ppGpp synthetase/guanosine-3',5'-bis(diphosphate) 3'-pyrophosphohydrolase [Phycisphaeraceae bacterium]|nr:bifunctional (p)ppGpp synthetase/guanosine-3',5'-bis(diphosphate) 3'-pyrophosphohydrolase [Phycisphaeraceae bacterium]MCW5754103.1 bifunctional (p)ppGpp synthetase/guanosine-3',5'-bis(diphosphate) 3'-pyrophosphohydrolase [Phycisphaeraceae bacterium]